MKQSKIESINLYSEKLKKEMGLKIYLPKAYNKKDPLPVLYFLHGRSGSEDIMLGLDIETVTNKLIDKQIIKPLIIVCPRMENSRGINSSTVTKILSDNFSENRNVNLGMYEDYFIKEIIPFIDNKYNTIQNKESRFIGGASAGGYTALHCAFRHQNLFSKVGGHMPALELKLEKEDEIYFTDANMWNKYDPIHIAKKYSIDSNIRVYLDAGDKDEGKFYEGCKLLHSILIENKIDSENHIFPGNHSPEYIISNLEKYLKFYGEL